MKNILDSKSGGQTRCIRILIQKRCASKVEKQTKISKSQLPKELFNFVHYPLTNHSRAGASLYSLPHYQSPWWLFMSSRASGVPTRWVKWINAAHPRAVLKKSNLETYPWSFPLIVFLTSPSKIDQARCFQHMQCGFLRKKTFAVGANNCY